MAGWRIPLFDTRFSAEEEEAVLRPLRAGWLTMGQEVLDLERELCQASGAEHAIAVSSGTAALHLACLAVGLRPGDEVLCPALTFVATANVARAAGASVRFCEITSPDDLTIDPAAVAAAVTDRTRAIMVVHYAGFACAMEAIRAIAEPRGIAIIEDCAHALFTRHAGKTLGLHGTVGCFSFYSNKNATCGEGGALLTGDAHFAAKLRLLRSHGMTLPTLDRHKGFAISYDVLMPGLNYRIDEIRAALLRAQLRKLNGYLARRRELFAHYVERFSNTGVRVPFTEGRFAAELNETGVHILPVLLPNGVDRGAVAQHLKAAGIQTSIHYPCIHTFSAYADPAIKLPRTESLAARELTLPLYPAMSTADVDSVVDTLLQAI